jgi:serine/threonine-protein kinase RsbW
MRESGPCSADQPANRVVLELSAVASNVRLARLAASGLGSQLGMTVEEIEDLRIAVDEACNLMLEQGISGPLRVQLDVDGEELTVSVAGVLAASGRAVPAPTRQVLNAVTDDWTLERDGTNIRLRLQARRDPRVPEP